MTKIRTLKKPNQNSGVIYKQDSSWVFAAKKVIPTKSKIDSIGHKFVVVPTFSTFLTT